eukprot:scaffold101379_cov69-Phaeocystis_antarctica.AAC.1
MPQAGQASKIMTAPSHSQSAQRDTLRARGGDTVRIMMLLKPRTATHKMPRIVRAIFLSSAARLAHFMLKAHLANIRSTSGLPRLDPFSVWRLCVGGSVSVRGGASSEASVGVA